MHAQCQWSQLSDVVCWESTVCILHLSKLTKHLPGLVIQNFAQAFFPHLFKACIEITWCLFL